MDKKNKSVNEDDKKVKTGEKEIAETKKARHDTYGSGYENKRSDYRSELTDDTAGSRATQESNTHRGGQHDAPGNNNEKDKDNYQERDIAKEEK